MSIKQWGFNLVPRGSVNNLDRSTILIGYPFAFSAPVGATDTETYLRTYLNDPTAVVNNSITPAAGSFGANSTTDYLRKFLNDV